MNADSFTCDLCEKKVVFCLIHSIEIVIGIYFMIYPFDTVDTVQPKTKNNSLASI